MEIDTDIVILRLVLTFASSIFVLKILELHVKIYSLGPLFQRRCISQESQSDGESPVVRAKTQL